MGRDLVNAICAGFPGAEVSDPWGGGHDAWKVGGKMFACVGVMFNTSVSTVSAGSTSVAPNGEINAEIETKKIIQLFIPELNTL